MNRRETAMLVEDLMMLQEQNESKCIGDDEILKLQRKYKLTKVQVLDTATFYSDISFAPQGKYVLKVCSTPCCHFSGQKRILKHLERVLDIRAGETTEDGLFSLKTVSCIGACDQAPAMLVNGKLCGGLTEEKVDQIIDRIRRCEK